MTFSWFHVNVQQHSGFLAKSLYRVFSGQEPPGPVVSVLTAGLEMEVIQAPVLELLAEILDADLTSGNKYNPLIGPITREGGYLKLRCFLNLPALLQCCTHPLGEVEFVGPVKSQDCVKVSRRSVKIVFPVLQRVGVTQLL